jgi:stress-induced morphogen
MLTPDATGSRLVAWFSPLSAAAAAGSPPSQKHRIRCYDIVIRKNWRKLRVYGPGIGSSFMAMDASEIERLIKAGIPDAQVTIRDLAGDGDHYAATVISSSFKGKSRVQQHQLVYQALKGQMGGVLHALALQTGTPDA